jgi:hypothetical protein
MIAVITKAEEYWHLHGSVCWNTLKNAHTPEAGDFVKLILL